MEMFFRFIDLPGDHPLVGFDPHQEGVLPRRNQGPPPEGKFVDPHGVGGLPQKGPVEPDLSVSIHPLHAEEDRGPAVQGPQGRGGALKGRPVEPVAFGHPGRVKGRLGTGVGVLQLSPGGKVVLDRPGNLGAEPFPGRRGQNPVRLG